MTATISSRRLYRNSSFQESEDSPFTSTVRPPAVFVPETEKELQQTIPKFKEESRYSKNKFTQPQNPNLLPPGTRLSRTLKYYEDLYKDQEMQLEINEQRKKAQKKDQEFWTELEKQQMLENQENLKEKERKRKEVQKHVAQEYRRQWEEKASLIKEQKLQEEKEYNQFIQKLKNEEDAEKQRVKRVKTYHTEKKDEFLDHYDKVLRRKEKQKEDEKSKEQQFQAEYEKTDAIRKERKVKEIRRMNNKNLRRDKLLERVARQLKQKEGSVAGSESLKNQEDDEQVNEQSNNEKTQEPVDEVVAENEEEIQKRTQHQLAQFQRAQIEERKLREKVEHDRVYREPYSYFLLGPDSF